MTTVDFTGFPANIVLAELYNCNRPVGMGLFQYKAKLMTPDEASEELQHSNGQYFDYLLGRPMKTSFKEFPLLGNRGYDRNAPVTMASVLEKLKKGQMTNEVPQAAPTQAELDDRLEECDAGITITSYSMDQLSIDNCAIDDFDTPLKAFDTAWLNAHYVKQAKEMNIPYPEEWFVISKFTDDKISVAGSMGGGFECDRKAKIFSQKRGKSSMFKAL